ncbi:unnamed protein product [Acanthoscelides obtectus]|nr:unnamed protein product [Acanthoscelides obtectus]CAK1665814.1 hypothetical protein AOBTE_LOCUS24977 [Acanthoscelides obtectus]
MLTRLAVCVFLCNFSIVYGFPQDIIGLLAEDDLGMYNGAQDNWQWAYENGQWKNVESQHRVRKRSADANSTTTSEGTNSTVAVPLASNNESLTNTTEHKFESKNTTEIATPTSLNTTEAPSKSDTNTTESTQSTTLATSEPTKHNGTIAMANSTASSTADTTNSTPTTENATKAVETAKEVETELKHSDKNGTDDKVALGKSPDQANSTISPESSSTTKTTETHLKTLSDSDKKGRKAIEKEDTDQHQSGNAVVTNDDKTMSETDVALGNAAAHESIKTQESASPKQGASSTSYSTGNDTKIIIFLGVAVAVVGVAAVGYNYARKRRRTNRSTPRAGQNGDVETGREMKPLMRSEVEAVIQKEADVKADDEK